MDTKYLYRFAIAGLLFSVHADIPVEVTESFFPFYAETSDKKTEYKIYLRETMSLPEIDGKVVYEHICYRVVQNEKYGYVRVFRTHGAMQDSYEYAVGFYDLGERCVTIKYLPCGRPFIRETGNCFFHIGMEDILMHEQRVILHAACVDTPLGGICFAGESGIGKSTQAGLWCRKETGRLINGDRTILHIADTEITGYGSPYAGSSKCYVNDSSRIVAILMLRQAKELSLRRLERSESFRRIYAGLTMNIWNKEFVLEALSVAERMAGIAPVFEWACDKEQTTSARLRELLKNEGILISPIIL